ncbi:hypothetical protein C3L33_20242, partial [Rhododendron williamsianum]
FGENAERENTQGQNRSKGKVSKVFQSSIKFLVESVDIKWKKRKAHDSNCEKSLPDHGLTRSRLQWKNVTLQFRPFSVGSNIPRNFTSLAASGGNEAYLKGQILPTPNLRIFSFLELKNATKNFRKDRLLGEAGFWKVYKGWLYDKNGSGLFLAVQKMNPESWQGFEEWQSELDILGRFSHPNLVKLLGYCWEENERLLVYEFVPKGLLEKLLFGWGSAVQPLPWDIRLNILIGAARGLEFLHTSDKQVIYRHFKTSNILLDEVSFHNQ